jgi:hypothetical protein
MSVTHHRQNPLEHTLLLTTFTVLKQKRNLLWPWQALGKAQIAENYGKNIRRTETTRRVERRFAVQQ